MVVKLLRKSILNFNVGIGTYILKDMIMTNEFNKIKLEPVVDTDVEDFKQVTLEEEYAVHSVKCEPIEEAVIKTDIEFCFTNDTEDEDVKTSILCSRNVAEESKTEEIMYCSNCDFKTTSRLLLDHHIASTNCISTHADTSIRFNCSKCPYTSQSLSRLQYHEWLHTQVKPKVFRCKECNFLTISNKTYKCHLVKHQTKTNTKVNIGENIVSSSFVAQTKTSWRLKCRKCKFVTDVHDTFALHLMECHNKVFFKCGICKALIKLKYLKNHMLVHVSVHSRNKTNGIANVCDVPNSKKLISSNDSFVRSKCNKELPKVANKAQKFVKDRVVHTAPARLMLPGTASSSNLAPSLKQKYATHSNINPVIIYNNAPIVCNTGIVQGFSPVFTQNQYLHQNYAIVNSNIGENSSSAPQTLLQCQNNIQTNLLGLLQSNNNTFLLLGASNQAAPLSLSNLDAVSSKSHTVQDHVTTVLAQLCPSSNQQNK